MTIAKSQNEQALLKRINRKLIPTGKRLRKTRGERASTELGRYYVQSDQNILELYRVDIELYAISLGV